MDQIQLDRQDVIPNGVTKCNFPTDDYDFRSEITNLLVEKKLIAKSVPLEDLHRHIPAKDCAAGSDHMNDVTKAFYETSDAFRDIYFKFIKHVGKSVFPFDFVFQEIPTIRFHFPTPYPDIYRSKSGRSLLYHCDPMNGHPFEELNCWVPLTQCYGSNALQLSSLDAGINILKQLCDDINYCADVFHRSGFDLFYMKQNSNRSFEDLVSTQCQPVPMAYGEMIFFNARCIHGPAENLSQHTRVSFDFRLIPVHAYERMTRDYHSMGRTRRKFKRGDVFYQKTVQELD